MFLPLFSHLSLSPPRITPRIKTHTNSYKDCRSGTQRKFAHSLRYLCAQRLDQDIIKRKSAGKTAARKAALAAGGQPSGQDDQDEDEEDEDEGDGDGDGRGAEGDEDANSNAQAGPSRERQGSASASPAPAATNGRSRAHLKKMERYNCRGSLVVNLMHDLTTAHFTINHHEQHPEYVDVVGNRLRGAKYHPLPVNLSNTIEAPKGSIEIGHNGQTMLERAEETFSELLQLVKDLRAKKGGGEEESARELYNRSEGCRSWRVSVLEALKKGGKGVPRPDKPRGGKKGGKKRAVSEVDDVEDGGADRVGARIIEGDMQIELQEEAELDPLRHLRIEHFVQGFNAEHLASLQQALPPLPDLSQLHQIDDGAHSGDLRVDDDEYSAMISQGAAWMDPTLS